MRATLTSTLCVLAALGCGGTQAVSEAPADDSDSWNVSTSSAVAQFEEARGEELSSTGRWRLEQNEEGLIQLAAQIKEACQADIDFQVDYASFSEINPQSYSLEGYCGAPVSRLIAWCAGSHMRNHIAERIREVRCQHGEDGTMRLTIDDGVIHWSVAFNDENSERVVREALFNQL